jgi:hypothetical protein
MYKNCTYYQRLYTGSKDVSSCSGVEVRQIFSLVWVTIETIFLSREPNVDNSRHQRQVAFRSNISHSTYNKHESVSTIHMSMVLFQCIALFENAYVTYHSSAPHYYQMLYSLFQIHDLNARNMYKDDKYCRRLTA